jgi:uncharacterized membrane protein
VAEPAPPARRPHEVTRLEGFSDAVFGFALTLLVVQLEAPKSSDELMLLVRASVPFAVTFAMVCYIWWEHNKFFRRYGLQDAWTAFLNSVLLFVVVFYVYPLKFLATALLGGLVGLPFTPFGDARVVMLIYSVGVLCIFSLLALLYQHAWSRQASLDLTPGEAILLRYGRRAHMLSAGLAAASIVLALVLADELMFVPGVIYSLMGPVHAWNGMRTHAALKKRQGA